MPGTEQSVAPTCRRPTLPSHCSGAKTQPPPGPPPRKTFVLPLAKSPGWSLATPISLSCSFQARVACAHPAGAPFPPTQKRKDCVWGGGGEEMPRSLCLEVSAFCVLTSPFHSGLALRSI